MHRMRPSRRISFFSKHRPVDGIVLVLVALLTAATGLSQPAFAQDDTAIVTSLVVPMGDKGLRGLSLSVGATMSLPDELSGQRLGIALPASGLSYSPERGITPMVFGQTWSGPANRAGVADGEGGLPWGWIFGGAVVVGVAALLLSSDDHDKEEEETITEENSCVFVEDLLSGDGILNGLDIDWDCIGG